MCRLQGHENRYDIRSYAINIVGKYRQWRYCVKVHQYRSKEPCFLSRACVMLNIPGCHGDTPPLLVSDVLVLHSNEDKLRVADEPLSQEKKEENSDAEEHRVWFPETAAE